MLFSPVLSEAIQTTQDSIIVPIVKAGTLARGLDNRIYRVTDQALRDYANTWQNGRFDINHKDIEPGNIRKAWYENGFVMAELEGMTQEAKDILNSPAYSGMSQECDPIEVSDTPETVGSHQVYDIIRLKGRGVAMMLYPHKPQCPLEEGCGVVVSEDVGDMPTAQGETVNEYKYDLARINNSGNIIKIREFSIYLYGDDINDPEKLKKELIESVSYGLIGSYDIYERNDLLQIGDEITSANPVHTIDVAVSGDISKNSIVPLNSDYTKLQIVPGGGIMDETEIAKMQESITAKDAEIESLKSENIDLRGKIEQSETTMNTIQESMKQEIALAVSAALKDQKDKETLAAVVAEAKTVMSAEVVDGLVADGAGAFLISATVEAIKKNTSKPGASSGSIASEDDEPKVLTFGTWDPVTKTYKE